jgi:hypothetical protein
MQRDDVEGVPTCIQRIGDYSLLPEQKFTVLRRLLQERKPAYAIEEVMQKIVLDAAQSPKARGVVGTSLSTIRISSNRVIPVSGGYSPNKSVTKVFLPDVVYLMPHGSLVAKAPTLMAVNTDTQPLKVRKVRQDFPCPCGSKKRYKNCHGKPQLSAS